MEWICSRCCALFPFIALDLRTWMMCWHVGGKKKFQNPFFVFFLFNCNIVDLICFLFSLIGTFCTGLWGGVYVSVCVCKCARVLIWFWYIPVPPVYPATAFLTILNRFLSLKREKKNKLVFFFFKKCSLLLQSIFLHDEIPGSHFQSFISKVVINNGKCWKYWTFSIKQNFTRSQGVKTICYFCFLFLSKN